MTRKITLCESATSGWHIRRRQHIRKSVANSETYCGRRFVPTNVSQVDSLDGWGAVCAACKDATRAPEGE